MTVHLMSISECIGAAFTERIFVKCVIGNLLGKSVEKLGIRLKSDKSMRRFTEVKYYNISVRQHNLIIYL